MDDKHIEILLEKYYSNLCSQEEIEQLLLLLKDDKSLKDVENVLMHFWQQIDSRKKVIGDTKSELLRIEALLLLSEHAEGINLKKRKQLNFRRKKYKKLIAVTIAASVMLSISVFFGDIFAPKTDNYAEYSSGTGESKQITLPDSSDLIVNSETRISIPSDFDNKTRVVNLEGECFFKVSPNIEKAFVVKNNDLEVEVLGTAFNVKAYNEDRYVEITVSSGKVMLRMNNNDLRLSLSPGERFVYDKKTKAFDKKNVESIKYTQWITGTLFFDRTPLQEVIKTLNREYKEKIILESKKTDFYITGTHDNQNIDAVLRAIGYTTKLEYKRRGNEIIIYEKN